MQLGTWQAWLIWLTAALFYLFEFIHRIVISIMIPELTNSFHASIAAIGILSAAYFYAYAFAQIPVGLLIDRFGTRKLLTISCLLIAMSSLVFANTNNIAVASCCRILIGLGSASAFVGCLKIASSWFPANRFGLIVGLTNLLGVTGAIIGGKPMAHVVETFDWHVVMEGSAVIGLFISWLLWHEVRDSSNTVVMTSNTTFTARLLNTAKNPQNWLAAAFASLLVAPIVTYSELWGVPFLSATYDLPRPLAAQIATSTFIGIAIGGPTIGFISDYYRRRKLPMLLGLLGALTSISMIILGKGWSIPGLYLWHILFGFCSSSMLLCFSLISEAAKASYRATAVGFTNSVIMIVGGLLQALSGIILAASHNFTFGFAPIFICYFIALICGIFLEETRCNYNL